MPQMRLVEMFRMFTVPVEGQEPYLLLEVHVECSGRRKNRRARSQHSPQQAHTADKRGRTGHRHEDVRRPIVGRRHAGVFQEPSPDETAERPEDQVAHDPELPTASDHERRKPPCSESLNAHVKTVTT
jgi:hypothetical protein